MTFNPLLKIIFIAFLSWFDSYHLVAQSAFPQNSTYDSLLNLARQQNKPLFLVVHQLDTLLSPFKETISSKTQTVINEQFVSGVVQIDPYDIQHPLLKAYHFTAPIYLFTDKDGFPLLRHNKPITHEKTLIQLIDSVHAIAKGETMGKLTQQYKKGMRNRVLLMNLLTQYQKFDQYTDQQVLYDYLSQLTIEELNNFETVTFLLNCGPIYNSKAYQLARTNHKMVDSLYSTLPLPTRKEINGRIIRQTFREALDKRNISIAHDIGHFANRSWQPHYLRAKTGLDFHPMEYHRLFRNTAAYISMARNYYNSNFYRVHPDSLAKLDFAYDQSIGIKRYEQTLDSLQNIRFQQGLEKVRKRYHDEHAYNLSYGARQLLAFGKDDQEALFDAIRWQKKAIALSPGHGLYHHTLAQLLYFVEFYAEAEAEQQNAIQSYKPNSREHKQMGEALEQMQARSWR